LLEPIELTDQYVRQQAQNWEANVTSAIPKIELPLSDSSYELEGYLHGDVPVCLIFFDGPPGSGPRLHRHPYAEVFIVQEGKSTFTVGDDSFVVTAGQIAIAPPNQPHKFVNSGQGRLRQLDIHCNAKFITEWLEKESEEQAYVPPSANPLGGAASPIELNQLPHRGSSHRLEGHLHGVPISLIFFDGKPGSGPGLHRHPYAEVFTSLEGTAQFTVANDSFEMSPGQIAIAQPNQPHKFVNTGDGRLRQIDIHCGSKFVQEELERVAR
jgi:mannose-6-phosphate isomerase-like protein (cupin superfamily)